MSGQSQGQASVPAAQRRDSMGTGNTSTPHQQQSNASSGSAGSQGQTQQQNLNQIVIEYLSKKGYNRTEAMLRQESANVDAYGRTLIHRAEDQGGVKYKIAFFLFTQWVDDNLDVYKAEFRRLKWPVFVYCFLSLVEEYHPELAKSFFDEHRHMFEREHAADIQALESVQHPEHIVANEVAKSYANNRYRITLTQTAYFSLMQFLESKERDGGSVINTVLQLHVQIVTIDRASSGGDREFSAMIAKLHGEKDIPDEDEGIPGHNPGSANTDPNAPQVLTRVSLGALPMDVDVANDVRDELEEDDSRNPPRSGRKSLIEEFDQKIKREPSEEAPSRDAVPLPKPLARDVAMEVMKIKEYRDRFKIEHKSGGVGPGVSITMFTFHNTFDTINCIDFSGDNALVAAGTSESYIGVWSLEGKPLPSLVSNSSDPASNTASSRRLIGHSGPVYAVSFSPSIASDNPSLASTNSRCLLSCAADKQVRLWSLDTWSCLVIYKGHDRPVWDVTWAPFGHYFVTGSGDQTARLWSTENMAPLRIFAGHDQDVDCVAFHPNNAYVFTGSSDKTIRMWEVNRGTAVRLFTGHTSNITSLSCAPNGRVLASGDDSGAIVLWDLANGRRIKRMRGHGKGGIWSLSWSVESSLLVSGGADNTVRVWDPLQSTDSTTTNRPGGETASGAKIDGAATANTASAVTAVGKKGRSRDATITADQISAFPTKKSPVYKVGFTHMNLILAGSAYMP